MRLEALPPRRVHERLASGWAMVGAVTYGALPARWRRHSPHFQHGHRITLIGWDGKASWILDPMARKGINYEGEPIPWSKFEPAWWSGEQLWFAEGMFRKPPHVKVLDKVPEGPGNPRRLAAHRPSWQEPPRDHAQGVLAEPKSGHFDAIVEVIPKNGPSMGEFIRVSSEARRHAHSSSELEDRDQAKRGSSAAPKKQARVEGTEEAGSEVRDRGIQARSQVRVRAYQGRARSGREPAPNPERTAVRARRE